MSKNPKQVKGQVIRPNLTMSISKEQMTQQIMNAKRRISATRGEMADQLGDIITREMGGISMVINQVLDHVDQLEIRNKELELKLKAAGIDPDAEAKLKTPKSS